MTDHTDAPTIIHLFSDTLSVKTAPGDILSVQIHAHGMPGALREEIEPHRIVVTVREPSVLGFSPQECTRRAHFFYGRDGINVIHALEEGGYFEDWQARQMLDRYREMAEAEREARAESSP